jgi:NADH-quinone oxidoreductase subunit L
VPGFSGFFSKDMILAAALEFGMRNPQHLIIFFGALLTAGMTAFYMFRMVIMTFFGEPKDHHKYDHAHESPPNMWVPLVILATLSFSFWFKSPFVEKGWFQTLVQKPASVANLPKAPAAEAPHASLTEAAVMAPEAHGTVAPSRGSSQHGEMKEAASSHGTSPLGTSPATVASPHEARKDEARGTATHGAVAHDASHDAHIAHRAHSIAMYSSVAVGTLGIVLAFGVYLYGWVNPARVANSLKPLYEFLLNKWYFDELYEVVFVNGSKAISRGLAWFDLYVVDGLVNLAARLGVFLSWLIGVFDNKVVDGAVDGVANVTIASGSALRRLQTGKLYHYVFALAGGALVIFLIKAF